MEEVNIKRLMDMYPQLIAEQITRIKEHRERILHYEDE